MAMVIACASHKGGVAKTTLCVNVSDACAREGHRVLLIDLDPQANATRHLIGDEVPPTTVYDLLLAEPAAVADVSSKAILPTDVNNLWLLPASVRLAAVERPLRDRSMVPHKVFAQRIERFKQDYDLIIIDTPPALSLFTGSALVAADWYFVPIEATSTYSLYGLEDLDDFVAQIKAELNPKLELAGAVITKVGRTNAAASILQVAQQRYTLFSTTIRASTTVTQTQMRRTTLLKMDRSAKVSLDIVDFSRELLQRCGLAVKPRKTRAARPAQEVA